MRYHQCTVALELVEQAAAKGRYNRGREITYREGSVERTVPIGAGSSDLLYLYREGKRLLLLSLNRRLDYVHLSVIEGGAITGELFLDKDQELEDVLGPQRLLLQPFTMVRRMAAWLDARAE